MQQNELNELDEFEVEQMPSESLSSLDLNPIYYILFSISYFCLLGATLVKLFEVHRIASFAPVLLLVPGMILLLSFVFFCFMAVCCFLGSRNFLTFGLAAAGLVAAALIWLGGMIVEDCHLIY